MIYPARVKLHHAAGKKTDETGWNPELIRVRRIHGKMFAEASNGAIVARVPLEGEPWEGESGEGVFHKKVVEELAKGTIGEERTIDIGEKVKASRGWARFEGDLSDEEAPPIPENLAPEQNCTALTIDLEQLIRLGKALGTKTVELMVPQPNNEMVQVREMVLVRAVNVEGSGEYTGPYGAIMPMVWRRK